MVSVCSPPAHLPYNIAVSPCLPPQMPWWLFPKSMRTTFFSCYFVDTRVPSACSAHGTVQGRCGVATETNGTPLRAHASESVWLYLPGLFSGFSVKTHLFLYPSSCCFSSAIYLFHGSGYEHVFFDILW